MDLSADRFLEDLSGKYAAGYSAILRDMVLARARGDRVAFRKASDALGTVIAETMGVGSVLGASMVLREAAKVLPQEGPSMLRADRAQLVAFADEPALGTPISRVTFDEALKDMVARTPVTLRNAAERTAQRISELYSEGRVVAFVKSAEAAVTERVQSLIAQAIREGIPEANVGRQIVENVNFVRTETAAWTEGYSRMAFRTNLGTAVSAGRFRQAQDPAIKAVIPCFRFDAVGDVDTRDNHNAADGRIFRVDNPVWNRIAPPLGYNCRCQVSLVSLPMLRRMGRVAPDGSIVEDRLPPGAFPDPGFRHGGRPDLFMVA